MAKIARSYANLSLGNDPEEQSTPAELPRRTSERIISDRKNSLGRTKRDGLGEAGKTVKQKAAQWMVYLDPRAVQAIKRYALDAGCKPTDCSIEAFEDWFRSKGINVPVRVRSEHYGDDGDV